MQSLQAMYVSTKLDVFRCPSNYVFLQVQAPSSVDVGINDQEQAKPLDFPSSDPNVFDPDGVLEDAMLDT